MFFGTRSGMEAKLVPAAGHPIEWIEIGGLKRVGPARLLKTAWQLPSSSLRVWRWLGANRPDAVFSLGGFAAGPVVAAAILRGTPIIAMEPNAVPGLTARLTARWTRRALVAFEETVRFFQPGRTEVTGLPVREEFFAIQPKPAESKFTVLITGGSQGSRTLNRAFRESLPLFVESGIRFLHQAGGKEAEELQREFRASGLEGEVTPFITDMPRAFSEADLVVCRAGAGAVAELAAAGKPSVLAPYPFAADNHQRKNAEAMTKAGAARLVEDRELSGKRLFDEITALRADRGRLSAMGQAAKRLGRPGAAARAADILEEISGKDTNRIDTGSRSRNNIG